MFAWWQWRWLPPAVMEVDETQMLVVRSPLVHRVGEYGRHRML